MIVERQLNIIVVEYVERAQDIEFRRVYNYIGSIQLLLVALENQYNGVLNG